MEQPAVTPDRLTTLPSRLLGKCAIYADRISAEALAPLHKWHYAVLVTLRDSGAASQATLSQLTGIHRSDMVGLINELVDEGYAAREPDPADRRRNVISLTRTGRSHLRTLDRRVDRAQEELLAPLGPQDRNELVRLLRTLTEHHATG